MSKTAIIAISRRGSELARSLITSFDADSTLYLDRRFIRDGENATPFDLPVRSLVQHAFESCQQLVLFMPVGAAVRLVAQRLGDKHQDPAVVCVDDGGRFAVSLVSGHTGGADALAGKVASALNATPVITSASHVMGSLAVDLLGEEFGWRVESDSQTVTRASAAMINGEHVGLYQEAGEPGWWPTGRPLPDNLRVYSSLDDLASSGCASALLVSDATRIAAEYAAAGGGSPVVVFRPYSLVAGMGCRKGVPASELEDLLASTLDENGLALQCLSVIATADLKREEPGILELAAKLGVPVRCFTTGELNEVFERRDGDFYEPAFQMAGNTIPGFAPTPSPAPQRLLGVAGVAEPAALLASGANRLLVAKQKSAGATVAVARRVFS